MKTKTSLLAASVAAALASSAFAQITPDPTGINLFGPTNAYTAGQFNTAFGVGGTNFYLDSNGNIPNAIIGNPSAPAQFTFGIPNLSPVGDPNKYWRAEGGTVSVYFLGETAGSLNDMGYIKKGADLSNTANYIPLATDIDNNNGLIASGWSTQVHYGMGEQVDFWLNNPGDLPPFVGGAYFSFILNTATAAFADGDATLHIGYKWYSVMTEYKDTSGAVVQGPVDTLVIAFEDLREAAGQPGENPIPADGDYTDFIFAFQFLPNQAVPEPSTYGMIGAAALLGLVGYRRFKASKKA